MLYKYPMKICSITLQIYVRFFFRMTTITDSVWRRQGLLLLTIFQLIARLDLWFLDLCFLDLWFLDLLFLDLWFLDLCFLDLWFLDLWFLDLLRIPATHSQYACAQQHQTREKRTRVGGNPATSNNHTLAAAFWCNIPLWSTPLIHTYWLFFTQTD